VIRFLWNLSLKERTSSVINNRYIWMRGNIRIKMDWLDRLLTMRKINGLVNNVTHKIKIVRSGNYELQDLEYNCLAEPVFVPVCGAEAQSRDI
jgi:hypothetical protein